MSQSQKKLIIISVIILGVIVIWSIIYLFFAMRIVKEMPSDTILPTSVNTIRYTFSQPISNHELKVTANRPYTSQVIDNQVMVTFSGAFDKNERVSINLSVNGKTWLMPHLSLLRQYEVRYVDYVNLSDEQKQEGVKATDTLPDQYPLSKKLPLIAKGYNIEYRSPGLDSKKMIIIIAVTEIDSMAINEPRNSPANLAVLRRNRDAAIAWLTQNGWDDSKYELYVAEPYLLEEYHAKLDQASVPYTDN